MKNYDRWMGVGGMVVSLIFLFKSSGMDTPSWGDVVGPVLWPQVLSSCLLAVSAFLIAKGNVDNEVAGKIEIRQVVAFFLAVLYVFVVPILGFLIATPAFLFLGCLAIGESLSKKRLVEAMSVAGFGTATIHVVFQILLEAQLPPGQLF